jgi:hypothetical protein
LQLHRGNAQRPRRIGLARRVTPVTRNLGSTGPSGVFVVYTDSIVDVTIAGAGVTRSVKLGTSLNFDNSVSLVVMK